MRLRPGLRLRFLRWGQRAFRSYVAIGLAVIIALYTMVVAQYAARTVYQIVSGQVSIQGERINNNGRTIADLEREVNRLTAAVASLQASQAAATPCPSPQSSTGPARPATSRPGVSAHPSPTTAPRPSPSLPIALPTPICVDSITCITLRPILAAC